MPFFVGSRDACRLAGCAATLVAGACALLTIGVAWVFYRPWLGIPLIAVGVGVLVMVFMKKKKASAATM